MESWITLFTAHGKAKVQLSHHDTVSYTHYAQCRLLRNPTHFFTEQDLLLQKEIIGWNGDTGACIEHSGKVEETD